MAIVGPRKKIDIQVTEMELESLLKALRFAVDNCDYSDEETYEQLFRDLGGND